MSQQHSNPPAGVGIEVVESSSDRLVIVIPPGGKRARGVGCFAVIWLAITAVFSGVVLFVDDADWDGGKAPPLMVMIPFLGIFWAVGIGMLIAFARMKFTQIYLAITPEQFAIQKTLFGRKKLKKLAIDQKSRAELVTSYTENDNPVYAIQMDGIGEKEKFGTGLSYEEKRWLATTINRFLGNEAPSFDDDKDDTDSLPEYCSDCGTSLMIGDGKRVCPDCARVYLSEDITSGVPQRSRRRSGLESGIHRESGRIIERPPALDPYELPVDSKLRIDQNDSETLAFSYRLPLPAVLKYVLGGILFLFCSGWFAGVSAFIVATLAGDDPIVMKVGFALFASLFLFAGLMPLGALLTLFKGRISIQIGRDQVIGSIGFLFLKKKKSISTLSISDVGLAQATMTTRRTGQRQMSGNFAGLQGCMIASSEFNMPLTMSSDEQLNAQVAGLARYQLDRLGVELAND